MLKFFTTTKPAINSEAFFNAVITDNFDVFTNLLAQDTHGYLDLKNNDKLNAFALAVKYGSEKIFNHLWSIMDPQKIFDSFPRNVSLLSLAIMSKEIKNEGIRINIINRLLHGDPKVRFFNLTYEGFYEEGDALFQAFNKQYFWLVNDILQYNIVEVDLMEIANLLCLYKGHNMKHGYFISGCGLSNEYRFTGLIDSETKCLERIIEYSKSPEPRIGAKVRALFRADREQLQLENQQYAYTDTVVAQSPSLT